MLDLKTATHNELWPIYERGLREVPLRTYDCFCKDGASITVFHDLQVPAWLKVLRIGDRAELSDAGSYELAFGCWRDDLLADLAFWNGRSIATLYGRAAILNFDVLSGWVDQFRPLRIFRSPVDWAVADGEGIVLINELESWRVLWRFDDIEGDDKEHCQHLRKILQPPCREIRFSFKRDAAA